MIPKYLKIKGLYSYQKEQEIQFDALTDAALFGIFGAVGSGKSSILEAITFALYGDTERLNKSGDERTYNMMNLRSDELVIDFECIAGKTEGRYRFTVRGKRSSKNFKDVKTFERRAYFWKENTWVPLPENEHAEQIIGLSYDNFRRTIIIPQGRFQEFIELKDAERTKMMKELFQLEKYDLSRNVGMLSKQNDMDLAHISGQLLGLGEVTAEMIGAEEIRKEEVRQRIRIISGELQALTSNLDQMQQLKLAFEKAQLLHKQLMEFESQRPSMEIREEFVRVFEICSLHFKSFLEQKKTISNAILRDQQAVDKNKSRTAELETLLARQSEIRTELSEQYEKREELLAVASELEKVMLIREYAIQCEKNIAALARGEALRCEREAAITLVKEEKFAREAENETRKSQLTDIHQLGAVKSWFATLDEIQGYRKTILKEAENLQEEIGKANAFLRETIAKADQAYVLRILPNADLAGVLAGIQGYLANTETERENLGTQILAIQTKMELQRYATNLIAGEPCPLCGSVHHPSVLQSDGALQQELTGKEAQRALLLKSEKLVRGFQSVVEKVFGQIENLEKQKTMIKSRYKETKDRIDVHDKLFVWEKFNRNDRAGFEVQFALLEKIQKETNETELLIKKMAASIEADIEDKIEKVEKPLMNLRNEILRLESTGSTLAVQLEKVRLADFDGQPKSSILGKVADLKKRYAEVKQIYENTEREIGLLEKEKNTIFGSQAMLVETLEINQNELIRIQILLDEQIKAFGFESENTVLEILRKPINLTAERKAVDDFKSALNNTKRDLELIKAENQGQAYEPEKHEQLSKDKENLTSILNGMQKEEGKLEAMLKKMMENLSAKAALEKEKGRLAARKEHLDDLARLFRSSGFVDYASSIYLQNLIQAANHRFHQMTHQRLHLELGEGNSFWVRDLLNGGHLRLLKTLSGGQKFQAALSLALALADHIHIRNASAHNFFFLDEGFGSLDRQALQTVFETLKSLRKENRIVGIISHVEDLQQEIQTYLRIEESDEGSKIVASWK